MKKIKKKISIKSSSKTSNLQSTSEKRNFLPKRTADFPESINDGIIYIVGEKKLEWVAVFYCPCGCQEIIQLNLLQETRPRWKILHHRDKTISVSPSINRIINCKSHFTISHGKLHWWQDKIY